MRLVVGLSLLVIAACSGGDRSSERPRSDARAPLRLVVLVVVDQLPTWIFQRDLPHLRGGIARMYREGGRAIAAELPYANPFTAPGHATIGTGATPSVHGVIANSWYRVAEGRERPAEYDEAGTVLAVAEPYDDELSPDDAASGRALRVDGIADMLRRHTGGRGKSVAISLKPRSAAFVLGREPDLAIWYEAGAGGMTTTRAYTADAPAWLREVARTHPAQRFFERTWTGDASQLASITRLADDAAPGEGGVHGLDSAFPHELAVSDRPARAFLHTSFADQLVLDTALGAIAGMQLGADATPDVLALGFNAHDYAGHLWGPESWEAAQILLDLDRALAALFAELDARVGRDAWAVVLTSDHGMTPLVERSPHREARRVAIADVARVAETAVVAQLGAGPWVAKVVASNVYFTEAFRKQPADARRRALDAVAAAIAAIPGIARAGRTEAACESTTVLDVAVCRSVFAGESGEVYMLPAAGSLLTDYTTGSHHDAPSDDNRRVPILVLAPGLRAMEAPRATLLQVAPTVTALLGVPPPPAASEPPLFGLGSR